MSVMWEVENGEVPGGMLWVLSANELHLVGTRRLDLSAMVPALWNINPTEVMSAPSFFLISLLYSGFATHRQAASCFYTQTCTHTNTHTKTYTQTQGRTTSLQSITPAPLLQAPSLRGLHISGDSHSSWSRFSQMFFLKRQRHLIVSHSRRFFSADRYLTSGTSRILGGGALVPLLGKGLYWIAGIIAFSFPHPI